MNGVDVRHLVSLMSAISLQEKSLNLVNLISEFSLLVKRFSSWLFDCLSYTDNIISLPHLVSLLLPLSSFDQFRDITLLTFWPLPSPSDCFVRRCDATMRIKLAINLGSPAAKTKGREAEPNSSRI